MTQTYPTVPVNLLAAITFYGADATDAITQLRALLPNHDAEITDYITLSGELIAANRRRAEKRQDTNNARNALIYTESRFRLDVVDRLRGAVENPHLNWPVDALYAQVKAMADPGDVVAVDRLFVAALLSGSANTACRELERRAGEARYALTKDLGVC
jgi:hypothetical protein